MASSVRDGESWKALAGLHVRDGEAWSEVQEAWVRDGGTWKSFYAPSKPSDLTASFNHSTDAVDLSWDPDPNNQQEIWRCRGGPCDPIADGTKLDTVAAGTSSYSDTGPTCDGGRTFSYQIRDASDLDKTNIENVSEPPCLM